MLPTRCSTPAAVLARVEPRRITVLPGRRPIYQALLDHPDRDSPRPVVRCGSRSPGPPTSPSSSSERIRDELPFEIVVSGYGLSEAGTATGTTPADDPDGRGHDRRPGPARLRRSEASSTSEVGAAGAVGDARLPRRPRRHRGRRSTPTGGCAPATSASLDDGGNLRIVGRLKDMFIVGGFNAYPAEIENALLRHPDVRQAAVIGIPDERLGEVGMAFVVTASADPTEAAHHRVGQAARWPTTRCPGSVRVRRRPADQRHRQGREGRAASDGVITVTPRSPERWAPRSPAWTCRPLDDAAVAGHPGGVARAPRRLLPGPAHQRRRVRGLRPPHRRDRPLPVRARHRRPPRDHRRAQGGPTRR